MTKSSQGEASLADRDRLIRAAFEGRENAYSSPGNLPFRVGAALLMADGSIVKGASVDSVTSGAICAERTAIVKAISEGAYSIMAIAIVSDVSTPISPCGLCRQVMHEFCPPGMPVLMAPADYEQRMAKGDKAGGTKELKFRELYPMP